MRIEKEKRKVIILCNDNSLVRGFIHINPVSVWRIFLMM